MRLLLCSDLHCDSIAAQRLVEMASDVDVIIAAGDFGTKHVGTSEVVQVLATCGKPGALVPGNAETDEELRDAAEVWPEAHALHGSGVTIDGVDFYGLGGAVPPTPHAWSFDLTEDDAANLLAECPHGGVLVTHSPPHGIADLQDGTHYGSTAIRAIIEERAPRLVVCGHIHASWTERGTIGDSMIINAGPNGTIYELD